jgi:hypothetical protein
LFTSARVRIAALALACLPAMLFPLWTVRAGQAAMPASAQLDVPANPAPHAAPDQPLPYSHESGTWEADDLSGHSHMHVLPSFDR